MNTIICGTRSIPQNFAYEWVDVFFKCGIVEKPTCIYSGGCDGPDAAGEQYAQKNNIELRRFHANWAKYGKAAGPIRNQKMIDSGAKCLLALLTINDDSDGTRGIIEMADNLPTDYVIVLEIKRLGLKKWEFVSEHIWSPGWFKFDENGKPKMVFDINQSDRLRFYKGGKQ